MSFAALYPYALVAQSYLSVAAPYMAAGAFVLVLVLLVLHLSLRRRLSRLALGRNGSFEESLGILSREMKEIKEFRAELEKYLKLVEARLRGAVQGIGVVRFNPFEGQGLGGNQSFAAAFLDEHQSGVVFSTLYTRDRVGVYAKPIDKGSSPYDLTPEEKSAIEIALQAVTDKRKKRSGP